MSVPPSMSKSAIELEPPPPPEASAPIHLPSEELYLRNLPSTFAVEL